jgi:hypothetical protein
MAPGPEGHDGCDALACARRGAADLGDVLHRASASLFTWKAGKLMNRSLLGLGLLLALVTTGCTSSAARSASTGIEAQSATSGGGPATARRESEADLEITRRIHDSVRRDPSLSTAARRVTIVTLGAVVTLRGNVTSNREREAIDRHARAVAGVQRIENTLSVHAAPRE